MSEDQFYNQFAMLQVLGQGSFSTVSKVQKHSNNKFYALKQVKLSSLQENEKQNALNEVRIISSISHENILRFKECYIDIPNDYLCLVTEYCEKGDLYNYIIEMKKRKKFFDENLIWKLIIDTIKGLNILHQMNIIYRDLKCANLLLSSTNQLKLADFNICEISTGGRAKCQIGTPSYASPEV